MDAATMREILKREYGINNQQEFEAAVRKSSGINIGIFTTPLGKGGNNIEEANA